MSKTYYFKRELEEREYEQTLATIIEASYQLALKNQLERETLLWEKRHKSSPSTPQ